MSNITGTYPAGIKPLGFEQVTVNDSAGGLTVPAGAVRARLRVEAEPLRWRDDGVDPTSTVGYLQKADEEFELVGTESLNKFQAIRDGGSNATLDVVYYG